MPKTGSRGRIVADLGNSSAVAPAKRPNSGAQRGSLEPPISTGLRSVLGTQRATQSGSSHRKLPVTYEHNQMPLRATVRVS